jgi:arylsulfatase A-like enzyme
MRSNSTERTTMMKRAKSLLLPALLLAPLAALPAAAAPAPDRPNILWISSEDHGPQMGCYGDTYATTPNVDRLAARGMLFKHAWSAAPVCAPTRTAIITGMFSPALGAEHMRSEVPMPAGQPFFAVFNATASHESQLRKRPHQAVHDPAKVRVPAYHPDTPEVRQDWAQYYDTVTEVDATAGRHLKELAEAGLAEDTIVFYWADHGSGMPRSKRWPCNSGLQVPVVVYFPEKWRQLAPKEYAPGAKSDRLISFVDFAPTLLSVASIQPPEWMQGHAFAGKFQEAPQPFLYGFRGRMDERPDVVRSVTDGRYVYLRNYMPHRSQGQHVSFQFQTPTTKIWWKLFTEGQTTEAQSLFWKTPKAPEELYDLENDPDEVHNLAAAPEHQAALRQRCALRHGPRSQAL